MPDHLEPARGFGYRKLETELMFGINKTRPKTVESEN